MSKNDRLVFTGEVPVSGETLRNHEFYIDAPAGYRIVSAAVSPSEDDDYGKVKLGTIIAGAEPGPITRALFTVNVQDGVAASVRYTVICEKATGSDIIITGTPVIVM